MATILTLKNEQADIYKAWLNHYRRRGVEPGPEERTKAFFAARKGQRPITYYWEVDVGSKRR